MFIAICTYMTLFFATAHGACTDADHQSSFSACTEACSWQIKSPGQCVNKEASACDGTTSATCGLGCAFTAGTPSDCLDAGTVTCGGKSSADECTGSCVWDPEPEQCYRPEPVTCRVGNCNPDTCEYGEGTVNSCDAIDRCSSRSVSPETDCTSDPGADGSGNSVARPSGCKVEGGKCVEDTTSDDAECASIYSRAGTCDYEIIPSFCKMSGGTCVVNPTQLQQMCADFAEEIVSGGGSLSYCAEATAGGCVESGSTCVFDSTTGAAMIAKGNEECGENTAESCTAGSVEGTGCVMVGSQCKVGPAYCPETEDGECDSDNTIGNCGSSSGSPCSEKVCIDNDDGEDCDESLGSNSGCVFGSPGGTCIKSGTTETCAGADAPTCTGSGLCTFIEGTAPKCEPKTTGCNNGIPGECDSSRVALGCTTVSVVYQCVDQPAGPSPPKPSSAAIISVPFLLLVTLIFTL